MARDFPDARVPISASAEEIAQRLEDLLAQGPLHADRPGRPPRTRGAGGGSAVEAVP